MERKRIVDLPGVYLKDNENQVDYKIVKLEEDDVEKIFLCGIGSSWADQFKDRVLFKIIDTGNGIKITTKYQQLLEADAETGIDYMIVEYLRILLNYLNSVNPWPLEYQYLVESKREQEKTMPDS